ncbi:hypothetical protein V8C40DRAFT_244100 [Trichoderma camerunense]
MSIRTIPTYHSAPNFSIPPPDANGPLQLGTLLADPSDPIPLNPIDRIPVQDDEIFRSHLVGFRTTTKRQSNGELGIFAKLLGLDGVGGKLSVSGAWSKEELLSVAHLDTEFFNPSLEYIKLAIEVPAVRAFCKASRDRLPLFLVTGIKIARGASASVLRGRAFGGGVEAGMPDLATGVGELGALARVERNVESEVGFEDASDFVLAYRVSRVKKNKDEVKAQVYTRGATMVSDDVQEVVDRDDGELEVIHDFASEIMETDEILLDETGIADHEPCRWVLHQM